MKRVRKVVIPVAGLGTRFLPATKAIPKEMLPLVDKPTIQYIVEEAVQSGIEEVIFITSPLKKTIENHFGRIPSLETRLLETGKLEQLKMIEDISNLVKFTYIEQDEPKGSGYAVLLAKEVVGNEPFAVMYGDDIIKSDIPALKQLIELYEKTDANIIGVQEVEHHLVSRYGIIAYENEETGKIKTIIEKPSLEEAPSNCAGLGRYIVKPEIFGELMHISKNKGEYQFTDAMLALMAKQNFYACKYEGTYYDIGNQLGYIKANIAYGLDRKGLEKELKEFMKEQIKE